MTRYRDEELGAALLALEVPEHRPGFYADLHRRLGQERAARRAEVRRRLIARRGRVRWGVRLVFAELKDPVRDRLVRYGLLEAIEQRDFFPTVEAAVAAFQRRGTAPRRGP